MIASRYTYLLNIIHQFIPQELTINIPRTSSVIPLAISFLNESSSVGHSGYPIVKEEACIFDLAEVHLVLPLNRAYPSSTASQFTIQKQQSFNNITNSR